jgi:hypothetical protein
MIGPSPSSVRPDDDPSIPNLTWVRTGPGLGGASALGLFSLRSSSAVMEMASYVSDGTRDGGVAVDGTAAVTGTVWVPGGEDGVAIFAVPEPGLAFLLLAGAGLLVLGTHRR